MSAQAASFKDLGNKHLQAGEFDQAIEAYTKAIEIDPSDHVFYSNRSAAYLSKGDKEEALSDAQKCVQTNPGWAKGYSRKGAAFHALRRWDDAVAAYEEGLKIAPTDAGLKSGLAEVHKAKESSNAPPAGGGLFGPQLIAKLAGHPKFGPKLADPVFMNKLKLVNSNPQLLMSDPELMEVLNILIGGAGGAGGDRDEDDYNPMSSSSPSPQQPASSSSAKQQEAPAPVYEPELSPEEREAKERKEQAVAAKERGNALYKAKKFEEAIAAYDEAFSIDNNMMFLNNKAAVYIEMGQTEKAIEICESALEVGKANRASYEDRAKVYQRIAAAHLKREDIAAAIAAYGKSQVEHFDKAIDRKIKNLELDLRKKERENYINPVLGAEAKEKGNAAFREGNFPEAIHCYEDAVKRDPTNAPYRNNLAAAYVKMGVFNDAKREIDKCIELDRNYVKAWAKKGDIEFLMKEYHKAMESYRAGLQIEPDNTLCKQGLEKVVKTINSSDGAPDKERLAHAMADPEIQSILSDPIMRNILNDMQENPKAAQAAMRDTIVKAKIEKLIAAGVLQMR